MEGNPFLKNKNLDTIQEIIKHKNIILQIDQLVVRYKDRIT